MESQEIHLTIRYSGQFKVAAVQFETKPGDIIRNLDAAESCVERMLERYGAVDLIVIPE